MFSKDDLRTLKLIFSFPEPEKDIVKTVTELPLNFLKFKKTGLDRLFLDLLGKIPAITFTQDWIGVFLSKEELSVGLGLPPPSPPGEFRITISTPSKPQRQKLKKAFSASTLKKVSIDLNFLLGKILGFVERKKEVKTSGQMKLVKKTSKKVELNSILAKDVCGLLKGGRLEGAAFNFGDKDFISYVNLQTSGKKISAEVEFKFSHEKPIDIESLIGKVLKQLNGKIKNILVK